MTGRSATEEGQRPAGSLRAAGIRRDYDGLRAVDDVTLELSRRQVLGLIGPNGAGKTTLVNIMSGFDRPDRGLVLFDGEDITGWPPHRRGRAGVTRTFQGAHAFSALSVRENIEVSALGSGATPVEARRRADELLGLLGLSGVQTAPAATLPHGHERALGVGRALATDPRFMLLDEPAAGLNDIEVEEFARVIRLAHDEWEAGILLIDHNIPFIMEVCDVIHVLDQGRTIAEDVPQSIRDDLNVTAAYLGRAAGAEGQDVDG